MSKSPRRFARLRAATARERNRRSLGQTCNRNARGLVIVGSVDAIWTTWMILMHARWLRLRSRIMTTRLVNWFGVSTHSSRKLSAPIDPVERPRRTFPK
jgi:hypothetical protein